MQKKVATIKLVVMLTKVRVTLVRQQELLMESLRAMIVAPFGLIGTVIGGVSGGAIGNQIGEGAEVDDNTASKNSDVSNNNSINK